MSAAVQCPARGKTCTLMEQWAGRARHRCSEDYCHREHEAAGKTPAVPQRAPLEPVTRSHP